MSNAGRLGLEQDSWTLGESRSGWLKAVAKGLCFAGLLLGLLSLAAWASGSPSISRIFPEYVPVSLHSAAGMILLGSALLLGMRYRGASWQSGLGVCLVFALYLLCAWSVGEPYFRMQPLLEERLLRLSSQSLSEAMFRMSPIAIACFTVMGTGTLALLKDGSGKLMQAAPLCGLLAALTNGLVLLGYIYGSPLLYGGKIRPVGIVSAVALTCFGISLALAAGPGYFPLNRLLGPSISARLLRVFLPLTFLVVLLDELVSDVIRTYFTVNPALREALQTFLSAIGVSLVVSHVAKTLGRTLDKAEQERRRAEADLQQTNMELEQRVQARTAELRQSNDDLRREVEQRQEAVMALQDSERRHLALINAIPDWMLRLHRNGMILDCKIPPGSLKSAGLPPITEKTLSQSLQNCVRDKLQHAIALTLQTRQTQICFFECALGESLAEFEARILVNSEDEVLVMIRDMTQTQRLERQMLEMSAREHRRISSDLHDGLGQLLTGLAFKTKILEEDLAAAGVPLTPRVRELSRLLRQAIDQVRDMARGIDPVEVQAQALGPALQQLAAESEQLFQVSCAVRCSPEKINVHPHAGLNLYRIAQEAIHNAVKHGRARQLTLELTNTGESLCLSVSDDGDGFEPGSSPRHGMGLRIMQYRANAIGATLSILSQPQQGAEIRCVMPFTPDLPFKPDLEHEN